MVRFLKLDWTDEEKRLAVAYTMAVNDFARAETELWVLRETLMDWIVDYHLEDDG